MFQAPCWAQGHQDGRILTPVLKGRGRPINKQLRVESDRLTLRREQGHGVGRRRKWPISPEGVKTRFSDVATIKLDLKDKTLATAIERKGSPGSGTLGPTTRIKG